MTTSVDYDDVSYVVASQYRVEILEALTDGPATPTTLADRTGDKIAHVSRALGELREHDLVELLVSEDRRKGRIYGLAEGARDVLETAREVDQ